MNLSMNIRALLLTMLLALTSSTVWAGNYQYNADVKGMVCAFCAYSVSKNISQIPGVDADSVDVDLKAGKVTFRSDQKVSEKKITELFSESGFTVSHLSVSETAEKIKDTNGSASIDLRMDVHKIDQVVAVFEAIGDIAASSPSYMIIDAPAAQEDSILKPLLMGRQQVIKIRFIPAQSDVIHLRLFGGQ